jgi:LPXTG-motif cell wall-anchored protein
MGLMELQTELEMKRQLLKNEQGIAPIIAGVIILLVIGAIAVSALAVYNITQRPDIVYNIINPGFSLAGVGTDTIWIIVGGIAVIIVLWLLFRKKK